LQQQGEAEQSYLLSLQRRQQQQDGLACFRSPAA
jgi:hypothetical protein